MNARQFFDKVAAMRDAQKEYFKTRTATALNKSKALEREVDEEISRVRAVLEARKPKQPELFDSI